jgi:hypothetical protein
MSDSDRSRTMMATETLTTAPVRGTGLNFSVEKWDTDSRTRPQVKETFSPPEHVTFDPSKHLKYNPPSKTYTMKELGYSNSRGVSPIGVSEPFPLFSEEAIRQMRVEVLSDRVWTHYRYSSNLAQCQLRGFAPE